MTAYAQKVRSDNPFLQTSFFKDSLSLGGSEFHFNSLALTNTSNQILELEIFLEAPCFANNISSSQQQIILQANEKSILPIRFSVNTKNICPVTWQAYKVLIKSKTGKFQTITSFNVQPSVEKKWKVELPQPVMHIKPSDLTSSFFIKIINAGNTPGNYSIDLISQQLALDVDKKNFSILLAPGESKLQEIKVKIKPRAIDQVKMEEINVFVDDHEGDKRMFIQTIAQIGNVFVENTDRWSKLPVTIELNTNNITGNNSVFNLRAFGTLALSNTEQVNFNYQSNNYNSYFSSNTGIQTIEYLSPKYYITAGSIFGFNNFVINGHGLRVRYSPKKDSWVEGAYIKSREGNTDQFLGKLKKPITKELTYLTDNFINLDHLISEKSAVSEHSLLWSPEPDLRIAIRGGIGFQQYDSKLRTRSSTSNSAAINIDKSSKFLYSSIRYSWHSKDFPGLHKGYTELVEDTRFLLGNFSVGNYIEMNKHTPSVFLDSNFRDYFNYQNIESSARFSYNKNNFEISILPGIFFQKQDSVNSFRADMKKVTTQMTFVLGKKYYASLINNIGSISVGEKNMKGIFSMYNILSVQNDKIGFFSRLDVGPYYYFEIKQYLTSRNNFLRFQFTPFYNLSIRPWNLNVRTQLSYFYVKPPSENQVFIINNVYWQARNSSFAAGINSSLQLNRRENTNINFFIRKSFNVPVFPKKGYKNIRIVLFKDGNNNGIRDGDEEVVKGSELVVNNAVLQTNDKGELFLQNVLSKDITIDLSPITNLKGWIPTQGYKQKLSATGTKNIIIPFKRGKLITGRIALDQDERSDVRMSVAAIRITAVSKNNITYYTITDDNGRFHFNVPEDEYVISINQNAVDESFKAIDPVRSIDLKNNEAVNVEFSIRQKRREIKILKQ